MTELRDLLCGWGSLSNGRKAGWEFYFGDSYDHESQGHVPRSPAQASTPTQPYAFSCVPVFWKLALGGPTGGVVGGPLHPRWVLLKHLGSCVTPVPSLAALHPSVSQMQPVLLPHLLWSKPLRPRTPVCTDAWALAALGITEAPQPWTEFAPVHKRTPSISCPA